MPTADDMRRTARALPDTAEGTLAAAHEASDTREQGR